MAHNISSTFTNFETLINLIYFSTNSAVDIVKKCCHYTAMKMRGTFVLCIFIICIMKQQTRNRSTIYYTALYYTAPTCFDAIASSSESSYSVPAKLHKCLNAVLVIHLKLYICFAVIADCIYGHNTVLPRNSTTK
jgi:hypothetical protein